MSFPTGIVAALDPGRLRLLVEVDRRGSISAAAEACQVSQPSATKLLKTLEGALGEKLVGSCGSCVPTPARSRGGAAPAAIASSICLLFVDAPVSDGIRLTPAR